MDNLVLLIYPKIDYEENYKYSWTPFSILSLAGVLEEKGFNPVLFDQNSEPHTDWFQRIEPYLNDAICVGFSVMTGGGQIQHAIELASQIREYAPSLPLVWGGPHVSALPEQTAQHPLVDFAIPGQGDLIFAELVSTLQKGEATQSLPSIYTGENGQGIAVNTENKGRSFTNKKDLPMYPWHLVNPYDYIRDDVTINTRTFGYVSSQGCPYRCRFCYEFGAYNAWWSGFEAKRLVDDIENLVTNFQINGVKFYDADFFVNSGRVKQFCHLLQEREIPIKWAGSANPNDILRMQRRNPEILRMIKETNCTRILMGMESGSDKTLELIDKQVTSSQLRDVAHILTDHGFMGSFTFIVGFPGETVDDLQATLDLVNYVHALGGNHESRIHIFAPYPGTPLFDVATEYGFRPHSQLQDWSDYNYYQPQTPWADPEIVKIVKEYTRMH